jgi:hypothetical protein
VPDRARALGRITRYPYKCNLTKWSKNKAGRATICTAVPDLHRKIRTADCHQRILSLSAALHPRCNRARHISPRDENARFVRIARLFPNALPVRFNPVERGVDAREAVNAPVRRAAREVDAELEGARRIEGDGADRNSSHSVDNSIEDPGLWLSPAKRSRNSEQHHDHDYHAQQEASGAAGRVRGPPCGLPILPDAEARS